MTVQMNSELFDSYLLFEFFSSQPKAEMPDLNINWFRKEKGYDPNVIKESLKKRYRDPSIVDTVIELDEQWRKVQYHLDTLKKQGNQNQMAIQSKKKANKQEKCEEELKAKAENQELQRKVEVEEAQLLKKIHHEVLKCGNLIHESVPVHDSEEFNTVQRTWGQIPEINITGKQGGLNHQEVLQRIGGFDPERGQKVSGHRGYFLKSWGVLLNSALVNYGIKFLSQKGYCLVQPPFFIKKKVMQEICEPIQFIYDLYSVTEGKQEKPGKESSDSYLISTSEQPLCGMHRNEWIEEADLPIRYGGVSTCFRRQAQNLDREVQGIFRVHQFQKVEQLIYCKPEDSYKMHEEIIRTSEEFLQALKLPYRVVNMVSGAMNDSPSKKVELEAWFPGYGKYRELASTSNCTDYQSRSLNIRCGTKKQDEKQKRYVHITNGTLCAAQRTLCCILQNFQTEDGVRVPQVLVPYVGTDFIKYNEAQGILTKTPVSQEN